MPTREIQLRVFRPQRTQAGDLIGERHIDQVSVNRALPLSSAGWCAATVDRDNDEALLG